MTIINAKIDLMFLSNCSDNEKSFSIKKNFLNWKNKTMFLRNRRGSSIMFINGRGRSTEPPPHTYIIKISNIIFFFKLTIILILIFIFIITIIMFYLSYIIIIYFSNIILYFLFFINTNFTTIIFTYFSI